MRSSMRLIPIAAAIGILSAAAPALAGDCPAGGVDSSEVVAGGRYKVVAVSPDDAYYGERASIIGRVGTVSDVGPDGCWTAGRLAYDDGTSQYFYQVELAPVDGAMPPPPIPPSGFGGVGCPPGAITSVRRGERLQVLDIATDDAYFADRARYIGQWGTDQGLSLQGGCYFSGSFNLDNGQSMYFYRAAFTRSGGAADGKPKLAKGANCPEGSYAGPIWSGQRVRILEIHKADAWYPDADDVAGMSGDVESTLEGTGCWVEGGVRTDDGTYRFFHKVAVGEPGERVLPVLKRATRADEVAEGSRVQLVDVHNFDFHSTRREFLVGKECVVTDGDLVETGPQWLGGHLTCGKTTYSFFRVRVAEL